MEHLKFSNENWRNRLPEIDIIPVIKNEPEDDYENETWNEKIAVKKKEASNAAVSHGKSTKPIYKNPFNYTSLKKHPKMKTPVSSQPAENKSNKWSCMICSEVLADKEALIDHYESHKNEREKASDDVTIQSDYFVCNICSKEFTSLKSYTKHCEVQHGEKQYSCEECNKSYKDLFQLCLHNYNIHRTDDKYHCVLCNFQTTFKKSLRPHTQKHEQEFKYKCEICGKGFSSVTWFEEHQNFHSGAVPFECDLCSKSFPYSRYLVAHKKSMHPEINPDLQIVNECHICKKRFAHKKSLILHIRGHTGENTVLCDMCGKRLSSSEHLKQHLRIHTGFKPYICNVCGKGFAKKCNLTLHERVHSGEKPYICQVCNKCFSQRSTLVIHGRYHTGERPYVCQLCNKGFVAKGLLSVHLKTCKILS